MDHPRPNLERPAHRAMPADDARELARLAVAMAAVVMVFAIAGVGMVIETHDPASAAGAVVMAALAVALIHARRQLLVGRSQRAVVLLVTSVLAAVLVSAPIPPPVPALAAAPIMAVAFALSFLDGRRLKVALIAAWVVAVVTAVIIEFTPASPDLPAEFAAILRVGAFAGDRRAGRSRAVPTPPPPGTRRRARADGERSAARQRDALPDGRRERPGGHLPRRWRGSLGAPQPGLGRTHRLHRRRIDRAARSPSSSTPTTGSPTPTWRGPSCGASSTRTGTSCGSSASTGRTSGSRPTRGASSTTAASSPGCPGPSPTSPSVGSSRRSWSRRPSTTT